MKNLFFILFIIVLSACNSTITYDETESGIFYKFHSQNEDSPMPKTGDLLVLNMQYYTDYDSLLFDTKEIPGVFRMQMKDISNVKGTIDEAFSMMHEGDSATFLIDANIFYNQSREMEAPAFIKPNSKLKFNIKLVKIENYDSFKKDRLNNQGSAQKEEVSILNDYLKRANITVKPTPSGLYYIETRKGNGKKPKSGNPVHVHYTGTFIDGKIFDTSLTRNEAFKFIFDFKQVISGLDEGVSLMTEGGTATLIIPSHLAYKDIGYKDLIPPYTTLIFEIELLKVE